jgi:hypothetical protein
MNTALSRRRQQRAEGDAMSFLLVAILLLTSVLEMCIFHFDTAYPADVRLRAVFQADCSAGFGLFAFWNAEESLGISWERVYAAKLGVSVFHICTPELRLGFGIKVWQRNETT